MRLGIVYCGYNKKFKTIRDNNSKNPFILRTNYGFSLFFNQT